MMRMLTLWLALMGSPAFAADADATAFQRSYVLEAAYDYDGALAQVDSVSSKADPYIIEIRRGWLYYLLGRYADSVASYDKAITAAPASVEARLGRTMPLMALRRWTEAEKTCTEVLGMASGNYLAGSRLAYVLYSSGRYADSAEAYTEVVKAYPGDIEMRAGLAWALLKLGKGSEARAQFQRVLSIAPDHASAREGLQTSG